MRQSISVSILTPNIHLFFDNEPHSKPETVSTQRNQIVRHSFHSMNEANICNKIQKIPMYQDHFSILEDFEQLNADKISDENAANDIHQVETEYYLFKYSDKNAVDFIDFLYSQTSIKKLLLCTFNTFQHVTSSLSMLHKNKICYFHISPQNIITYSVGREKPLIRNFKYSLQVAKLSRDYIFQMIRHIKDFTYMPFEIHILYYILNNPESGFNEHFIEEFCSEFVENVTVLRLFSTTFKNNYKRLCVEMAQKYCGKDSHYIVADIIERNSKWNVYGLSMIFIHIFGCIINTYSLKDTFLNKMIVKLLVNLHPDSSKRLTLEQSLGLFNKYLCEQDDWKFVNNLDNNKLTELFKEFAK